MSCKKGVLCSDDVCVLSATGTAAIVNVRPLVNPPTSDTPEPPVSATIPLPATKQLSNMASSLDRTEFEVPPLKPDVGNLKNL
ncbi:hypothetical protein J6590_030274 [Homalodisca vitripennis]|nr:hypothetical protein J6590_030274 [Homalodisca vitripennis]